MGTNFYGRISVKSSKARRRSISMFQNVRSSEITPKSVEIHIGKRSGGWKFLFNANEGKLYDLSKRGINNFIRKYCDGKIYDEYGRRFTIKEFWDNEINIKEGYDLESYYRENKSDKFYYSRNPPWSEKYKPNMYGEFYSHGLRFTVSPEFS